MVYLTNFSCIKQYAKLACIAGGLTFFGACSSQNDPLTEKNAEESTEELLSTETNKLTITPMEGNYIVVFKEKELLGKKLDKSLSYNKRVDIVKSTAKSLLSSHKIKNAEVLQTYTSTLTGINVQVTEAQAAELAKDERVAYIEKNQLITLPTYQVQGSDITPFADETPWGISRVGGAGNGTGKTAWIIDTGVDQSHPDLNVNTQESISYAKRYIWIFPVGDDKDPNDGNGHGTHVAGTIAAEDDGSGVVGVAPGAKVVGVKVLSSTGSGSNADVIKGVDYVANNGSAGDVANMSLGGGVSQALEDAIKAAADKGILFSLAAGNESQDANNVSPARMNHPNVFTISAMDSNDNYASFSNYGNPPIDYCAPGVAIKSTWKNGGYNTISGTSMAAPHAAGVLLLTGGKPSTSGTVNNDPDGDADAVISR